MENDERIARVRVCVHKTCCLRGSEGIYDRLAAGLSNIAEVTKTDECFRLCESGPNVAVNGAVISGVHQDDALSRVRREIVRPARKIDGVGTRSLDELDDVLEGLFP